MPKGKRRVKVKMNRAVGAHNKGDEFTADPEMVDSLVGAGYAEVVSESEPEPDPQPPAGHKPTGGRFDGYGVVTGGPDGDEVRGEPGDDADSAAADGDELQP